MLTVANGHLQMKEDIVISSPQKVRFLEQGFRQITIQLLLLLPDHHWSKHRIDIPHNRP